MDEKRKVKRIYEIEEIYDERFCAAVGHTHHCVDDTVYAISLFMDEWAKRDNFDADFYFQKMPEEEFTEELKKRLVIKPCKRSNWRPHSSRR